jgi:hypothetical protein
MSTRAAMTMMMGLAIGCGPEVIQHDDGGGTGSSDDPTSTDDGSSGTDESTTGEPVTVPAEGPYGAGTRLLPVVERTDDGVTQLVHWFDAELGIDCEFVRDSIGTTRCLPMEVSGVFVGFAASDCTEPVVGVLACASVPTHVRGFVPGAAECSEGARQQGYLRGAPVGSGAVGGLSRDGTCSSTDTVVERYELTPIDDEDFVAATVVTEHRGSVMVRALVADDGAFVRHGLVDPRTGTACRAAATVVDDQAVVACSMPSVPIYGFADATCTTSLAAYPDDGTCEPSAIKVLAGVEEWLLLDEAWTGPRFDTGGESACEEMPTPLFDPYSHHTIGEPIPAIDSPSFARVIADDPGRLRRTALAGDGETLVLPGIRGEARWYDTLLDQECAPAPDDGGELRCFPLPHAHPSRLEYWGDAACTEIPLFDTVETDASFTRVSLVEDDDCGGVVIEGLQNVVGLWDGPVYGPSDDEPCALQEIADYVGVYQLGNYAQLDDAPLLELTTDE